MVTCKQSIQLVRVYVYVCIPVCLYVRVGLTLSHPRPSSRTDYYIETRNKVTRMRISSYLAPYHRLPSANRQKHASHTPHLVHRSIAHATPTLTLTTITPHTDLSPVLFLSIFISTPLLIVPGWK